MSQTAPDTPALEPTFEFLVATLRMQAEMHLGLMPMPGEEKALPANLPVARHFIDVLAMLVDKTKGNLTAAESRMLENSVTELRFRFVMAGEKAGGSAGSAAETR